MSASADGISYSLNSPLPNDELNALFASAWGTSAPEHPRRDFGPMLERSLAYACAHSSGRLVGFVNLA